MSYSMSFTVVDGMTDIDWENFDKLPYDKQTKNTLDEAVEYATMIVGSGILGDVEDYEFSVYVSGHHNPDCEPVEGWANDHLTLNIVQTKRRES